MKNRKWAIAALSVFSGLALTGCYDNNYCDVDCNADPSGVYEGSATDSVTQKTTQVIAIIDENGDGTLSGQDGTYYRFSVGTSGTSLGGNYQGFNGSNTTTTSGSISGALTQAGVNIGFNGPNNDTVVATLNFDNVYDLASSLPTLEGNWSATAGSFTLNLKIQPTGDFTGTDTNGCSYNVGNFGIVFTQFNAYTVNFSQTCNSITDNFSGLASYFPASGSGSNAVPAQILFMADDGNGGNFISFTLQ
ncbi:MAG: hypothetical protein ACRETW_10845 [Stenotrophobium sp.]